MLELTARAHDLDQARRFIGLGFQSLEITLPCPGGSTEEKAWRVLLAETGTILLAHGPQEGNPSDMAGLQSRYLPALRLALEAGARLGIQGLTVHFWFEPRWIKPEIIQAKIGLLARVTDWGRELGLPIWLENLSESADDLATPLEAIPELDLTLDVGHAQIMQKYNVSVDIIRRFGPRLGHLHLHDNRGGPGPKDDLHLTPGAGTVPFKAIFAALQAVDYRGRATLEVSPDEMAPAREWVQAAWK